MDLLDNEFSKNLNEKTSVRDLNIGIANLHNGSFVSFNNNFKTKDLLNVLKASVSFPGVFEPLEVWNSLWVSGSSIWKNDAAAPILRCKAKGFADKDIIIDAIIDIHNEISEFDASTANAFEMGVRTYNVMNYYSARESILKVQ
jgi:predicted acylesterase/phospholipase RssA